MSNPYSQDYERTQQASINQQETSQQAYVQPYDAAPTSQEVVPARYDTTPQPQLAETSVQRFPDFNQPQYEPSVTPQDYPPPAYGQQAYGANPYAQQQYAQPAYAQPQYAQPQYAPGVTSVGVNRPPANGGLVAVAWVIAICTLGIMIPWAIAVTRNHRNMAVIGLLNLFLFWSVIGWIVALVMACSNDNSQTNVVVVNQQAPQPYYQQPPQY